MNGPIKVGVVGVGALGQHHARIYAELAKALVPEVDGASRLPGIGARPPFLARAVPVHETWAKRGSGSTIPPRRSS